MKLHDLWQEALPELQTAVPFDLEAATPVVFRVGSHAHGTYVPPEDPAGIDDLDLMVVVIPPPEHVLGFRQFEHSSYKAGKLDVVFYDWRKWLLLLSKSNPNVVGTIWNDPEDVLFPRSGFFLPLDRLFAYKRELLSQRMYMSFVGYAKGQLYKMEHFAHQGYMGDKRKKLVEQFGYDVKNAAHLVRLLRMACETMEDGVLNVRRSDAQELIDIKQGRWSKQEVLNEANRLFDRANDALLDTLLPDDPNEAMIQDSMIDGYKRWWAYQGLHW